MFVQENKVIYGSEFLKDVRRLPHAIQEKLAELLETVIVDVFDSRLHTKPLGAPLHGIFSFRITRGYRVGFKFYASHVIQLLVAGTRDKIYKKLRDKK